MSQQSLVQPVTTVSEVAKCGRQAKNTVYFWEFYTYCPICPWRKILLAKFGL